MKTNISCKNMELSDALARRVEKKVGKLSRYFGDNQEVQVRLTVERARNIAELTVLLKGGDVLRAEETGYDMYLVIDDVCEKLERQIHKHRTRLQARLRDGAFQHDTPAYADEAYMTEQEPALVKRKSFPVKPMTPEDAIAQMELLGHSFFAFVNSESNRTCVVYVRNDGNYGLLQPGE